MKKPAELTSYWVSEDPASLSVRTRVDSPRQEFAVRSLLMETFNLPGLNTPLKQIKTDEIDLLDDVPGVYAWHVVVPSNTTRDDTLAVLHEHLLVRKYDVELKSFLAEQYEGRLGRSDLPEGREYDPANVGMLILAYAPPVYIGMSMRLRTRLKTHWRAFQRVVNAKSPAVGGSSADAHTQDTDSESSQFGERMGAAFLAADLTDHRWLEIRVMELPFLTESELKDAEYYANRLISPFFGRR